MSITSNAWGLPDWCDPTSYGDTSKWTMTQWRWEFTRRRADVRAYFDKHAQGQHEHRVSQRRETLTAGSAGQQSRRRLLEPHEPGFTVNVDFETSLIFGYHSLPNPRISKHPFGPFPTPYVTPGSYEIGHEQRHKHMRGLTEKCRPGRCMRRAEIGEDEIRCTFDLNAPLGPQLQSAKEALEDHQHLLHGKKLQVRRHPAKWLTYLRVLDAHEAKASYAKIAEILLVTARNEQAARDILQQARGLRF